MFVCFFSWCSGPTSLLLIQGRTPKNWNYLLEGRPLVQASPTKRVFWEPVCISVPAGIVVRGCVQLQWIFSGYRGNKWWWAKTWPVVVNTQCSVQTVCGTVVPLRPMEFYWPGPPNKFNKKRMTTKKDSICYKPLSCMMSFCHFYVVLGGASTWHRWETSIFLRGQFHLNLKETMWKPRKYITIILEVGIYIIKVN